MIGSAERETLDVAVKVEPTTAPLGVPFEMIVMRGAGTEEPQPTVLSPHGGPHSCAATTAL